MVSIYCTDDGHKGLKQQYVIWNKWLYIHLKANIYIYNVATLKWFIGIMAETGSHNLGIVVAFS